MPERILIVDHEHSTVDDIASALSARSYEVERVVPRAGTAPERWDSEAMRQRCDLAIVGYEVGGLQWLQRCDGHRTIVIVADGDQLHEEMALRYGASDVVTRSTLAGAVAQRARIALEGVRIIPRGAARADAASADSTEVGPLQLYDGSRRAYWQGRRVRLARKEFELVAVLAREPGRDRTHASLWSAMQGSGPDIGDEPDPRRNACVRSVVRRVRRKFRTIDPAFDAIECYDGFGYRWRVADHVDASRAPLLEAAE